MVVEHSAAHFDERRRVSASSHLGEGLRREVYVIRRFRRDEHALQLPDVDRVDSLATELATQHRRMIAADSARVRAQRAAAEIAARLTVANVGARIEKPPW